MGNAESGVRSEDLTPRFGQAFQLAHQSRSVQEESAATAAGYVIPPMAAGDPSMVSS
jgi:hypothetical protein